MNKLSIYTGNVIGTSGYASHTRNLSKALSNIGYDVGIEVNRVPPKNWENMVENKIRLMLLKEHRRVPSIMIDLPNNWFFKMGEGNKNPLYGYGVWEGDRVPHTFALATNQEEVNRVFVPSKHTRDAFVNSGTNKDKIDIVPHGVWTNVFTPQGEQHPEFISDKFTFFYNGGWVHGVNDRKGLDLVMKAYNDEFGPNENVKLLIKLNKAYMTPGWNVLKEVNKLKLKPANERGEIQIINTPLSDYDLAKLYRSSDVHIITSKAEAFCMPLLESMSCGKPVITSEWGGQREFCSPRNSYLVKMGDLVPATDPLHWYRETNWRIPDIDSIRKKMRLAYENEEKRKKKAKLSIKTAKKFDWIEVAKRINKIIQQ